MGAFTRCNINLPTITNNPNPPLNLHHPPLPNRRFHSLQYIDNYQLKGLLGTQHRRFPSARAPEPGIRGLLDSKYDLRSMLEGMSEEELGLVAKETDCLGSFWG